MMLPSHSKVATKSETTQFDDHVIEDNPARIEDAFIEQFDLRGHGFASVDPKASGRQPHHPAQAIHLWLAECSRN